MKILSIDPGETTGYVILEFKGKKIPLIPSTREILIGSGEIKLWVGLEELISFHQPKVIIYESFKLYPWKTKSQSWSNFLTVEVIGIIKYLCETKFCLKLVEQTPSLKKFYDDKKLKKCNLYKNFSPHIRDALRHGLYYLDFKK